jgi:CheY-like chemotaxis protein
MINSMSDVQLDEGRRKSVGMASSSARALASVINNILDFSALDGGRASMAKTVFSVSGVVQASVDSFRARAEAKSLTLLVNILPNVPEMVEGDETRVRQVLDNLIENAIKFTKFGGIIVDASLMAVHGERVQILFNVSDTGIGIDDDRADRLFKPFTQIDGSFTREFGGAGLGLAIIKRIVELMDGKIWFDSTPGDGSKFSFYVTLKPVQCAAREEACPRCEEVGEIGDLNGMRVLLVEDNEMNQMIAEELLSEMGAETTIANNGLEALDILQNESFDIVLMDIQMPEMDGITATINIRRNPAYADLPILALTAHSLPSDRDRSLSSGMNDHLSKPIDAKILYSALKRWGKR